MLFLEGHSFFCSSVPNVHELIFCNGRATTHTPTGANGKIQDIFFDDAVVIFETPYLDLRNQGPGPSDHQFFSIVPGDCYMFLGLNPVLDYGKCRSSFPVEMGCGTIDTLVSPSIVTEVGRVTYQDFWALNKTDPNNEPPFDRAGHGGYYAQGLPFTGLFGMDFSLDISDPDINYGQMYGTAPHGLG